MAHPLMPFVTEELWQRLPGRGTMGEPQSIMLAPYPSEVAGFENAEDVIHAGRSLRAQYSLTPQARPSFTVRVASEEVKAAVVSQEDDIITLTKVS